MATMDSPAARHSAVVVEDLIQGLNEWRNIQDIVRLTFKAFHDVLKAQGEAIRTLERANEAKANKSEVASALQHKAGTADLNAKLMEINAALATKADGGEVANQLRRLSTKSDMQATVKSAVAELRNIADQKVAGNELQSLKAEMDTCVEALRVEVRRKAFTEDMVARLEAKASITEVNQALQLKADAADAEEKLKDRATKASLTSGLNKKANKTEMDAAIAELRQQLLDMNRDHGHSVSNVTNDKADRHEVDELRSLVSRELAATHEEIRAATSKIESARDNNSAEIRTITHQCEKSVDDLKHRLESFSSSQDSSAEKLSSVQERVAVSETKLASATTQLGLVSGEVSTMHDRLTRVESSLTEETADRKAASEHQREMFKDLAQEKADASDLADLRSEVSRSLELKSDVVQVNEALGYKANIAAVNIALERIENQSSNVAIKEQLEAKADVKDVCALVDLKSNISDVNAALAELQRGIDSKCPLDELRRVVRDQAVINASLCADCSIGRWIWKSGKTKAGHSVPWNVQSVNTDPENFMWEKDKVTIMTVAPGLYEVTFGFFTHRKPTIQLLINGEPVLAAINSSSYVVHHSSGRMTSIGRHPAGNVTGLTLIDFLALPPRARVAITYSGEETGEGFISLKKL